MEPTRVFDLLSYQSDNYPCEKALCRKVNGEWKSYSIKEIIDIVNRLSAGLRKLGVGSGDKVAIVSGNRPEWNFADFAVQQLGAVSVPMYPTISTEDYKYIIGDAGVKVAFAENEDLYGKIKSAAEGFDFVGIYTFEKVAGASHWTEAEEAGRDADPAELEPLKAAVKAEDLLTLIYTSGTTGRPKGVMLTHDNIISNVTAVKEQLGMAAGEGRVLSFLPLSHIFERTGVYAYLYGGASIYYAESTEKIGDNLREIKPLAFDAVPRLLEKVYDKIIAKGYELTGIKKTLFFWAVNLGLRYEPNKNMGILYDLQLKLANKLIFNKWREALGGNIQSIISGASALQPRLARIFWAAGIPVREAYGLTETSPGITVTPAEPENVRIGTVGMAIKDVEIKIAEDGEILCKGPNIMKGYYNKPEMTAEAIDADGWFHTGDIGLILEGKYLKITDRKKSLFKTSGGKYIAPQVMENRFKESPFIEQIMVLGNNRKFPVRSSSPISIIWPAGASAMSFPATAPKSGLPGPKCSMFCPKK